MSCTSVSISNGYILSSLNLYNTNETVTYYCNTFYYLSGNPVATCLDTYGNWTSIPSCNFAATKNGKFDLFLQTWKVFRVFRVFRARISGFLLMCSEFVSFCFTFVFVCVIFSEYVEINVYLGIHFGCFRSQGIRLDFLTINLPLFMPQWHAEYIQLNW